MDSNIKKYFQTYIQTNEGGFYDKVYLDTKGIATIGYGTNLTTDFAKSYITNNLKYDYEKVLLGKQIITIEDANNLFQNSYNIAIKDASNFVSNFDSLSPERQLVLIDMSYNIGSNINKFINLKSAIEEGDWERASSEILNSKYASDVKSRANRNAEVMKNGTSESTDEYLKDHKITIDSLTNIIKENNDNKQINPNQEQVDIDAKFIDEQLNNPDNPVSQEEVDNADRLVDSEEIKSDAGGVGNQDKDINWGGTINTTINQIGSIIISNQNFSNVEKIVVSSSVATLANFAEYKYSGS